jgi:predicted amidohydrolase
MAGPLRLALSQFGSQLGDVDANLGHMRGLVRAAAKDGAGLICFPELCLSGYLLTAEEYSPELLRATAEAGRALASDSAALNVTIVYGTPVRTGDGRLRNAVVHQSPDGRRLDYLKTHLAAPEQLLFAAGDEFVVDDAGVGLACCYDLAFPEAVRVIALSGARVLLAPMAWEVQRGFVMRRFATCRAVENIVYVVCVNQSGTVGELEFMGLSCVIDPLGEMVVDLANDTEFALVEIDLDLVRRLRDGSDARTYPLYSHRRPELYRTLTP